MRSLSILVFAFSAVLSPYAAANTISTDEILGPYFAIHKSLAADSTQGIREQATKLSHISTEAARKDSKLRPRLEALSEAAAKLNTSDLEQARGHFGELSKQLAMYLQTSGASKPPQFYCPMAKKAWFQPDKNIRNPYYGSSMLKCGELVP